MTFKTFFLAILIFFSGLASSENTLVFKGIYNGINSQKHFIVVNDMQYNYDQGTRVYNKKNSLRSLKALKPGYKLELTIRAHTSQVLVASGMVIDKIVYSK